MERLMKKKTHKYMYNKHTHTKIKKLHAMEFSLQIFIRQSLYLNEKE